MTTLTSLSTTPALAALSDDELADGICTWAGRVAAGEAELLRWIAEFDRRSAWSGTGITSCAHWLAWSCSMSPATAREHVRVARALTSLPLVSDMFAAGTLSYSKVRALTRIAAHTDEATLVRLALAESASQLERTVRGHRRATGAGLAQQRRRRARMYWDENGMLVVSARLTAEEGAVLMAAVAAAQDPDGQLVLPAAPTLQRQVAQIVDEAVRACLRSDREETGLVIEELRVRAAPELSTS